ncbi:MAG TPA: cytochrome C oxidase assembly protein [Paracoccaceae bacterium]|nr:cytochrome C oxidase assembly protein [Paracoccaceae bacterium]
MLSREHELHRRRRGRNSSLGLILGGFVLLIFVVTVVKLSTGGRVVGYDHAPETLGSE